MTQVAFNFATWTARYPEFAGVDQTLAGLLWAEAGLLCDNTDGSPIPADPSTGQPRAAMLYAALSHIAWLQGLGAGNGRSGQAVGRVSDASQGSVSASFELKDQITGQDYWAQTQYGLYFWQLSAPYRKGFYVPPPCRPRGPFGAF